MVRKSGLRFEVCGSRFLSQSVSYIYKEIFCFHDNFKHQTPNLKQLLEQIRVIRNNPIHPHLF